LELLGFADIYNMIERIQPVAIYNLGAQSFAGGFRNPVFTADVAGAGPLRLLEPARRVSSRMKFYEAFSRKVLW
jgi:GDP-D-mannose dehydratase